MAASTGEISGTVTNTSAEPIEGIEVCAYSEATEDFILECTTTKSNGKYTIAGLPSGEYEVEIFISLQQHAQLHHTVLGI